jgi:hypothetical protein
MRDFSRSGDPELYFSAHLAGTVTSGAVQTKFRPGVDYAHEA